MCHVFSLNVTLLKFIHVTVLHFIWLFVQMVLCSVDIISFFFFLTLPSYTMDTCYFCVCLLWRMELWALMYKLTHLYIFWSSRLFSWELNCWLWIALCFTFWEIVKLVTKVAIPFWMPIIKEWGTSSSTASHTITSARCCLSFDFRPPTGWEVDSLGWCSFPKPSDFGIFPWVY